MKKENRLKNNIVSFFCALFIVASFSIVSVTGFTTEVTANTIGVECTCAERINWFGKCRGETTRFCKGDTECRKICGEDDQLPQN